MNLKYDRQSKEYSLILDNKEKALCSTCKCKLEIPFYICEESRQLFCNACEKKGNSTCSVFRALMEHSHFKIMKVKKVK